MVEGLDAQGVAKGTYSQEAFSAWGFGARTLSFSALIQNGKLTIQTPDPRVRYELTPGLGGKLVGRRLHSNKEVSTAVFSPKRETPTSVVAERANPCSSSDSTLAVRSATHCIVLHTFGELTESERKALVVVIHGTGSSRWPMVSTVNMAEALAAQLPVTAVAIIRPGYIDRFGGRSFGGDEGRIDNNTAANLATLAETIRAIQERHRPSRTVLVGHSSGAAAAAALTALYPGIADGAVLLGCPCDTIQYNARFGMPTTQSISPHLTIDGIPRTARIVAVAGEQDRNVGPQFAEPYIAALKRRGIAAQFVSLRDVDHDGLLSGIAIRPILEPLLSP